MLQYQLQQQSRVGCLARQTTEMFYPLDEETVEIMKAAFKKADKDGKGKLSANELKEVLKVVVDTEIDDKWTEMLMRALDDDGDKMLNYEELAKLFTENKKPGEKWKILFRMVDVQLDGKLCKKDIAKLRFMFEDGDETSDETKDKVNSAIKTFDEDGDGLLNYEEFCKLMEDEYSDSD